MTFNKRQWIKYIPNWHINLLVSYDPYLHFLITTDLCEWYIYYSYKVFHWISQSYAMHHNLFQVVEV